MKRRRKTVPIPVPTFEDRYALVKQVYGGLFGEGRAEAWSLQIAPPAGVTWTFARTVHGDYALEVRALREVEMCKAGYGPTVRRTWGNLDAITYSAIENAFLHVLTLDGSDWYRDDGVWRRMTHVYG